MKGLPSYSGGEQTISKNLLNLVAQRIPAGFVFSLMDFVQQIA